ncbi:MAG TPA: UDP-3-O-acyl-N-acetylglucosamine deacetylase [Azospirillum sp.]|nr:UDP-3-O-acyl-N-acetylglucosamine deacetylase [Azospirillum sp.]
MQIGGISNGLFQRTLKRTVRSSGIGLHSGSTVSVTIAPAAADSGITFVRTDLRGRAAEIRASWDKVVDTRLCTVIGNADGATIGTIEHLMAALAGCGIDNAVIGIDAAEVPVMDGSAAPWVEMFERAGIAEQTAPRRAIRVLKPVTVGDGVKSATLTPDESQTFSFEIDFDSAVIHHKVGSVDLSTDSFRDEISQARTFGFLHEVDAMRNAGLARGGSLDNAVVVDKEQNRILNAEGLRFEDEFVRHKILDAIGDLYLAGGPIIGHFHGVRSGHALNNQLLRALFADRGAWCYDAPAALLPAGWTEPARRAVA